LVLTKEQYPLIGHLDATPEGVSLEVLTDVNANQVHQKKLIVLTKLDSCLKKQAAVITRRVPLADWRASFNPPQDSWWWFLEAPTHRLDRFDWFWNALTVTSLTASLPQIDYNLGRLYEDLEQSDKARTQYRLAAQGDLDAGYNELARLSIENKKYSEAVSLLFKGLELVSEEDKETRYALWKNLGWAQLEQKRYAEAETSLREAISFNNTQNQASAHCLLAQVLEEKDAAKSALTEWENCLKYANPRYPEEYEWIEQARQRIDQQKP